MTIRTGILICLMGFSVVPVPAEAAKPVSREYVVKLVDYMKQMNLRVKKLERELKEAKAAQTSAAPSAGGEESVDLSQMDESKGGSSAGGSPSGRPYSGYGPSGGSDPGSKSFRVYFDLNLINQPGYDGGVSLSFENFHAFLLLEASPIPELKFSFDVNPSPNYYELEYQITPRFSFRAGKIWIPFDQNHPHPMYGGRMVIARLTNTPFLPNLWTELGVAAKAVVVESKNLTLDAQAYVTNGISQAASDPLGGTTYPSFTTQPVAARDNNNNKALGGRVSTTFLRRFSLNGSYYTAQWSSSGATPQYITMMGADGSLRFPKTELKFGYMTSQMDVPTGAAGRGGSYGELTQKIGANNQYRVSLRSGILQPDDRVIDKGDQKLAGALIGYTMGLLSLSLEHYVDLETNAAKTSYHFTNLRLVVSM